MKATIICRKSSALSRHTVLLFSVATICTLEVRFVFNWLRHDNTAFQQKGCLDHVRLLFTSVKSYDTIIKDYLVVLLGNKKHLREGSGPWNAARRACGEARTVSLQGRPLTSRQPSRNRSADAGRTRSAFQSAQLQAGHAAYFFIRLWNAHVVRFLP